MGAPAAINKPRKRVSLLVPRPAPPVRRPGNRGGRLIRLSNANYRVRTDPNPDHFVPALSAASHKVASKPRLAQLPLDFFFAFFLRMPCPSDSRKSPAARRRQANTLIDSRIVRRRQGILKLRGGFDRRRGRLGWVCGSLGHVTPGIRARLAY